MYFSIFFMRTVITWFSLFRVDSKKMIIDTSYMQNSFLLRPSPKNSEKFTTLNISLILPLWLFSQPHLLHYGSSWDNAKIECGKFCVVNFSKFFREDRNIKERILRIKSILFLPLWGPLCLNVFHALRASDLNSSTPGPWLNSQSLLE